MPKIAKYPQRPIMVSFMVNYNYEKERLKKEGKQILPPLQWYHDQVSKIQKLCLAQNMGSIEQVHDQDFKLDEFKETFLLDAQGNKIPDSYHYHGLLISYAKTQRRLNAWAELLETFGVHISKVNAKNQLKSNIRGISNTRDAITRTMAYYCHYTPQARKMGKTLYDPDTVAMINMEPFFNTKSQAESRAKYRAICEKFGQEPIKKTSDEIEKFFITQRKEIDEGKSLLDIEAEYKQALGDDYPAYEAKYLKALQVGYGEYIKALGSQLTQHDRDFNFIHIFGPGGVGKSQLAKALAPFLAGDDMRIHTASTQGKKKTPDFLSTYQNELVSLVHELKPTSFSVEDFESFADPHIYPTISSRNKDKPYFARAVISAQATSPDKWLYSLYYWDKLYGDKGSAYFAKDEDKFPQTYNSFYEKLEEDFEFAEKFRLAQAEDFLDEWYQLIRRFAYVIRLAPMPKAMASHGAVATIYKLKPYRQDQFPTYESGFNSKNKKDREAANVAFKNDFDFWSHFDVVSQGISLSCPDVTDSTHILEFAKKVYTVLVQTGLHPVSGLPKLIPLEELQKKYARPLVPCGKPEVVSAKKVKWPETDGPFKPIQED
ncbi:MAG: hypothetical protein K2O64_00990 [Lactobacillus sp.]|nr:hypothetical protein [Lactobacillus sp.]